MTKKTIIGTIGKRYLIVYSVYFIVQVILDYGWKNWKEGYKMASDSHYKLGIKHGKKSMLCEIDDYFINHPHDSISKCYDYFSKELYYNNND